MRLSLGDELAGAPPESIKLRDRTSQRRTAADASVSWRS